MSLETYHQIYQHPNQPTQKNIIENIVQSILQVHNISESQLVLLLHIDNTQGALFQTCLKTLQSLIRKGFSTTLVKHAGLLKKLMVQFIRWSRQLSLHSQQSNKTAQNQNIECRMIYLLSLIAQLIRQNSNLYFPFTKRFILAVFEIDYEQLKQNPHHNHILAILAVIYQNFSKQCRLVNRYRMSERLKMAIFENYSLVEQLFCLKLFNRAMLNLARLGVKIQSREFIEYQIFETLNRFIEDKQDKILTLRLKSIRHCNRNTAAKFD